MLWILTAVLVFALIVALMMVMLVNHPPDVKTLGSVSDRWIAEHRVE